MNDYVIELLHQIEVLQQEVERTKEFVTANDFNCTSAPYTIVQRYRNELNQHIHLLREVLYEIEHN